MDLEWITPGQAAALWGVSARRVQALCISSQIEGSQKLGRVWLIPKNTPKPPDGRAKNGRKPVKREQGR